MLHSSIVYPSARDKIRTYIETNRNIKDIFQTRSAVEIADAEVLEGFGIKGASNNNGSSRSERKQKKHDDKPQGRNKRRTRQKNRFNDKLPRRQPSNSTNNSTNNYNDYNRD